MSEAFRPLGSATPPSVLRVGDAELDAATRTLRRKGERVPIQDRPFDLIWYLALHAGRVVSRAELLREVWSGVRVGPQALGFALHAARSALGDDGKRQRVIRTVARRGVRLVAEVRRDTRERPGSRSPWPFLDRGALLGRVEGALDEAGSGRGRVLVLSGEPGIGRSRALERIGEVAARRGFAVARGRAVSGAAAPPLWPWIQALGEATAVAAPHAGLEALARAARELEDLEPSRGVADPLAPFARVAVQIARAAAEVPLCFLLDDLHQCDERVTELLLHLAEALRDSRVLLVASHVDGAARWKVAAERGLAAVARLAHCHVVDLAPLSTAQIGEIVGMVHGLDPSREAVATLEEKCGGNPLLLAQLVAHLDDAGRLAELERPRRLRVGVPKQIALAARAPFERLSAEARGVVEAASVVGERFRAEQVALCLDGEAGAVASSLDEAVARGLLRSDDPAPAGLRFRHGVMRDAIYEAMPQEIRCRAHQRLARAMERACGGAPGPRDAELAYHFTRAGDVESSAKALGYHELAASRAMREARFEAAVEHLEAACRLCAAFGLAETERLARLQIELGDARTRVGDREGARDAFFEAAAVAEREGLYRLLCEAALHCAPDFLSLETGVYDASQVAVLERALAGVGTRDREARSRLLARLAVSLHWSDEGLARVPGLLEEARRLAASSRDPTLRGYLETAAALAGFSVASPEELLKHCADPGRDGDPAVGLVRRLVRITACWLVGEMGAVRREVQEFGDAARALEQPQALWYEGLLRATLAQMEGRYAEAAVLGRQFVRDGEQAGDRNAAHSYVLQSFMTSLDLGGVEELEAAVRGMVEQFPRVEGWRSGLLLFLAETGRCEEADDLLAQLLAAGALARPKRNEWYALVGAMAMAAARTGNSACAARLYDVLRPHADQLAVVGYGSFCWGSTEQLLGLCAGAAGDVERAIGHFGRALVVNRTVGAMPAVARTHLDLALALARGRRREESDRHRGECLRIARAMGMKRLEARARERA